MGRRNHKVFVTLQQPGRDETLPRLSSSRGRSVSLDVLFGRDVHYIEMLAPDRWGPQVWERSAIFEGLYFSIQLFAVPSTGQFGLSVRGPLSKSMEDRTIVFGLKTFSIDGEVWNGPRVTFTDDHPHLLGSEKETMVTIAVDLDDPDGFYEPALVGIRGQSDVVTARPQSILIFDRFPEEDAPWEPTDTDADIVDFSFLGRSYQACRAMEDGSREPYRLYLNGQLHRSLYSHHVRMKRLGSIARSKDGEHWPARLIAHRTVGDLRLLQTA